MKTKKKVCKKAIWLHSETRRRAPQAALSHVQAKVVLVESSHWSQQKEIRIEEIKHKQHNFALLNCLLIFSFSFLLFKFAASTCRYKKKLRSN